MEQLESTALILRAAVVTLQGEFDIADRPRLVDAFEVAVRDPVVIVDLRPTAYMDSTILRELVRLHNLMALGTGKMLITKPSGSVWRLFEVTQVGSLFETCPSVEEPLAEFDLPRDAVSRITLVGRET